MTAFSVCCGKSDVLWSCTLARLKLIVTEPVGKARQHAELKARCSKRKHLNAEQSQLKLEKDRHPPVPLPVAAFFGFFCLSCFLPGPPLGPAPQFLTDLRL